MTLNTEECRRILGVPADATPETIRQVYLDLVRVWHPDRFQSDERLRQIAQNNLRQINDAYAALKNGHTTASSHGPSQSRPAEARAGANSAAGQSAATATEDDPPQAAPPPFRRPVSERRPRWRAAAIAACCAGPVWAVVQMVTLARAPRTIEPPPGVPAAADTPKQPVNVRPP